MKRFIYRLIGIHRLYEESLRKRAEEAEERRIEAEERRRGQELLVDVTSHELRQPLSAVSHPLHSTL
jgi:signal transduction histidine kinase